MPNESKKRKELSPEAQRVQRDVGAKIKLLRKRRGLSQEDLAGGVGKSVHAISSIERGITFASLTTLLDMTRVLQCELQDLFEVDPATPVAIEIRAIGDLLKGRPLALAQSAKKQIEILVTAVGIPAKPKS